MQTKDQRQTARHAYDVGEIAEMFGVSRQAVTTWIKRGELRALDVSTNPGLKKPRYRVRPSDLEEFEQRRERGGADPEPTPPPQRRSKQQRGDVISFFPVS